jgi:hypothetical protein
MHAWSEDNIPFIIHLIGKCISCLILLLSYLQHSTESVESALVWDDGWFFSENQRRGAATSGAM